VSLSNEEEFCRKKRMWIETPTFRVDLAIKMTAYQVFFYRIIIKLPHNCKNLHIQFY
jgi:hypothetical protein